MRKPQLIGLLTVWLLICFVGPAVSATELIDERVSMLPSASCSALPLVSFAGQEAIIQGSSLRTLDGAPLYTGEAPILDAFSKDGTNYILTDSALIVVNGKKTATLPLGEHYRAGKLLFAQPTFFVYYLTDAERTMFFTRTATSLQLYFAAGQDFVTARLDNDANTIVANRNNLLSVDFFGRTNPLFDLGQQRIESLELLLADNSILLGTANSLLKFTPSGGFYTVISGKGALSKLDDRIFWCDTTKRTRFELQGLGLLGQPASDRDYARKLLTQGKKLIELELNEQAYKKFLHVLEMMPDEPEARQIAVALGKGLYGRN